MWVSNSLPASSKAKLRAVFLEQPFCRKRTRGICHCHFQANTLYGSQIPLRTGPSSRQTPSGPRHSPSSRQTPSGPRHSPSSRQTLSDSLHSPSLCSRLQALQLLPLAETMYGRTICTTLFSPVPSSMYESGKSTFPLKETFSVPLIPYTEAVKSRLSCDSCPHPHKSSK